MDYEWVCFNTYTQYGPITNGSVRARSDAALRFRTILRVVSFISFCVSCNTILKCPNTRSNKQTMQFNFKVTIIHNSYSLKKSKRLGGLLRDLNPGPLAP
jgi:hypothetical protein